MCYNNPGGDFTYGNGRNKKGNEEIRRKIRKSLHPNDTRTKKDVGRKNTKHRKINQSANY